MNDFIEGISDLFRYNMHDERAAFERQIDEEPTDANTHLIYADWLDDHDEPQEAAFRRSMGNWFADHHKGGTSPKHTVEHGPVWRDGEYHTPAPTTSWHAGVLRLNGTPNRRSGIYLGLPNHIRPEHFEPLTDADWDRDWSTNAPERRRPYAHIDPATRAVIGWQWDSYRDMEEAFRRAFRPNNN